MKALPARKAAHMINPQSATIRQDVKILLAVSFFVRLKNQSKPSIKAAPMAKLLHTPSTAHIKLKKKKANVSPLNTLKNFSSLFVVIVFVSFVIPLSS